MPTLQRTYPKEGDDYRVLAYTVNTDGTFTQAPIASRTVRLKACRMNWKVWNEGDTKSRFWQRTYLTKLKVKGLRPYTINFLLPSYQEHDIDLVNPMLTRPLDIYLIVDRNLARDPEFFLNRPIIG